VVVIEEESVCWTRACVRTRCGKTGTWGRACICAEGRGLRWMGGLGQVQQQKISNTLSHDIHDGTNTLSHDIYDASFPQGFRESEVDAVVVCSVSAARDEQGFTRRGGQGRGQGTRVADAAG
jgi:hypothetical protein